MVLTDQVLFQPTEEYYTICCIENNLLDPGVEVIVFQGLVQTGFYLLSACGYICVQNVTTSAYALAQFFKCLLYLLLNVFIFCSSVL